MASAERAQEASFARAELALSLLAIDPALKGAVLRGTAHAAREAWVTRLQESAAAASGHTPRLMRIPANVDAAALAGGLDLAATLAAGKPVHEAGVLARADGAITVWPMAERLSELSAATLASEMDEVQRAFRAITILFDESTEDEASVSSALQERVAFVIDEAAWQARTAFSAPQTGTKFDLAAARWRLTEVHGSDELLTSLCATAFALGVPGMRAVMFAHRAARAIAALDGRDVMLPDDVAMASALVLAPRATRLPTTEAAEEAPPQQESNPSEQVPEEAAEPPTAENPQALDDVVLAATVAAMPRGLLARLAVARARGSAASSGRAGAKKRGAQHGRVTGATRGDPRRGGRVDILATLRAAAPWQHLRAHAPHANSNIAANERRLLLRRDDIRIKRYESRAETTTLFVVDASGSAALERLAEAKGAVELMLAECYVRRDRVGVVSFRGRTAEVLLPPTRSLTRAKRALASLPGGGGTPLALGIDTAVALSDGLLRRGDSVVMVLLTDGRANVNRAGVGERASAEADALAAARLVGARRGITSIVVDTGRDAGRDRQGRAASVAHAMAALYLPMPHAKAATLAGVLARQGGGA